MTEQTDPQADDAPPVALITGGARRIGAVIAATLHTAGYRVMIHCNRSREDADALADTLNGQRPASAAVIVANLVDDAVEPLVEASVDTFGRLDALVNNASTFYPTPIGSITRKHWNDLMGSNARAPLFLAQAAAPHLRASRGAIVNLIDIYADAPLADHAPYVMAKAALAALTRSLARDLAPEVRVNGVSPGAILWPEADPVAAQQAALIEATPLKRMGSPEDIAQAVLFFLAAPFVSGQILAVDGGRSILPGSL